MPGDLLADRQNRAERLHGLDRFGLARKGTILWNKNFRAKDDRQGRHREH